MKNYYVRGKALPEGNFMKTPVTGGFIYSDLTLQTAVFVPDPSARIFDSQEKLDWQLRYDAPLSDGAKAWVDQKFEQLTKLRADMPLFIAEHQARTMIANQKPLIYSFLDQRVSAEDVQALELPRPWWKRLLGL